MKKVQVQTEKDQTEKVEDDENDICLPEPPDGGWGWWIVFASFMCNAIVDGIIFSFGIFLTEFAMIFSTSKATVAWIGSLQAGFYLMAGPVVSALANTYGCRPVTIVGSILAALAFGVSFFANSITFLVISMGLFGGIGFGFIFLPAIVTVGFYFDQRRALATGIAVCGSGVGAFALAPLVQYMLSIYGWKGCLLVLSGIILHCCFFGAFFRPLEPRRRNNRSQLPNKPLLLRIKEARDMLKNWDSEESVSDSLLHGQTGPNAHHFGSNWKNSNVGDTQIQDSMKSNCSSGGSNTESTLSQAGSNGSPPPSYSEVVSSDMLPCVRTPDYNLITRKPYARERLSPSKSQLRKGSCQPEMLRPFYRQDILFSASLLRIPEFRSQPDMKHYQTSITHIPHDDESSNSSCCSSPMTDTFRQMLDLSLLTSPTFILLATSGFLTLAGFFVPFIYIIDRAAEIGISKEDATLFLSVIGITNTIGRVFCGWLSDMPQINALVINNCALAIGGLATILNPFLNSYPLLMVYCVVFGFSIACFAALRSIIAVELLGLENLTNAFGLLLLFQGIATIIGSPVAGLFFDLTGSYDASFYIAGTLISISGIMCFPLPYLSLWEKRRKNRTESIPPEIVVTDSGIAM